MASFGINIKFLKSKPKARFHHLSKGNYETLFLKDLVTIDELEAKANNCRRVYFLPIISLMKFYSMY
jgi:hypothetical protein